MHNEPKKKEKKDRTSISTLGVNEKLYNILALTEDEKKIAQKKICLRSDFSFLVFQFLNPPTEDPAQLPQEKNLASQQTGGGNTRVEDTLQTATASSPYNLRASTRKRTLSTDGEGTGGKISRQENPGKDQEDASQANNEKQRCAFLPGLYRDLSK